MIIERPRFQDHVRAEVRGPELVVVLSETSAAAYHGRLLPLIVPWMDGTRTVAEIAAAAGATVTPVDVLFGVQLIDERYLAGPPPAQTPLRRATVVATEGLDARGLEEALQSLGIAIGEPAALTLVLTDDYLRPGMARAGAWMPVKAGAEIWFGPIFFGPILDDAGGACWKCLEARLREWRRAEAAEAGDLRPVAPQPAAALDLALRLAAIGASRYLFGEGESRTLFTFDWVGMRLERHAAICLCQDAANAAPVERLEERPPGAAETMLERFGHLASPITGIVGRLDTYGVEAIGVAAACEAPYVLLGKRRTTSGKGASRAEAAASALAEAIERYSGAFRGSEERRLARYADLRGDAVHPASLLHFSAHQYRDRETTNRTARPEQWVPAPFDEERAIEWSAAWSVTGQRRRWVPAAYCYYGYPLPEDHRFCAADSNGCAAGLTREDAALHGLLELIERDAVALWWYNGVPRRTVTPDAAFIRRYAALGREVRVFDITSDLGVPVFAAISWRPECESELILGFGAGFDGRDAARRALAEMNQFVEADGAAWARCVLNGDARGREFLLGTTPAESPAGPQGSLVDRLRSKGLEVLVLDQTRGGVNLPVVRTMVPGLRHFWPRFAPGRLYDVPVTMGWRDGPCPEDSLNRTAFFC